MIDQNLVLSNENGASNWVEDHTNVKPLQNHVKIHHFILGNKLNLMISKLRFQWNIIPSLKSVYSKPRKPQNEVYSTQGCSWMVLKLSTEVASKYFFLWYRMFWPPMRTLPLGHPWIRGFIPYLVAVETVNCFTRQSAMESSVVSSLPDHAFTPTLASTGWNDQLWNTLHHVSHIVDCSPSALLPSGELS